MSQNYLIISGEFALRYFYTYWWYLWALFCCFM